VNERELWNKCGEIDGLQAFMTELKAAGFEFDNPPVRFDVESKRKAIFNGGYKITKRGAR